MQVAIPGKYEDFYLSQFKVTCLYLPAAFCSGERYGCEVPAVAAQRRPQRGGAVSAIHAQIHLRPLRTGQADIPGSQPPRGERVVNGTTVVVLKTMYNMICMVLVFFGRCNFPQGTVVTFAFFSSTPDLFEHVLSPCLVTMSCDHAQAHGDYLCLVTMPMAYVFKL